MDYDIEHVNPNSKGDDSQQPSTDSGNRMLAIAGLFFVVALCCFGTSMFMAMSEEPTETLVEEEATPAENEATDFAMDDAEPTPNLLPLPTIPPEPTEPPCDPMDCPTLIGFISYEMQESTTYTRTNFMACPYSNVLLNATGQYYYLIISASYDFPGDPSGRLGRFLVERADYKCRFPVLYLNRFEPFDQDLPENKIVRVDGQENLYGGSSSQGATFGLPIPTDTPTARLSIMPKTNPLAGNTPPPFTTPTPTVTPTPETPVNVQGMISLVDSCLQTNYSVSTTSGELLILFDGAEMPPLGYQNSVSLVGYETYACNRLAIRATKATYENPTATPYALSGGSSGSIPATPTPTPQKFSGFGSVDWQESGCGAYTVMLSADNGKAYFLELDSFNVDDYGKSRAFVRGSFFDVEGCRDGVLIIDSIEFIEATATPEEEFEDLGLDQWGN